MNLANVADAYNLLLLLISITLAIYWGVKFKSARGLMLIMSAVVVYSLMFLDIKFLIWPFVGLDYSTHTATALAMCMFIGTTAKKFFIKAVLALSLAAYFELMVILGYHTWTDIFSTAVPVGLILYLLYYLTGKNKLLMFETEKK